MNSSIWIIIAIGVLEPRKDRGQVVMQYLTEVHLVLITYHLFLFTDYMIDMKLREMVG
jgi:hypothetical protein